MQDLAGRVIGMSQRSSDQRGREPASATSLSRAIAAAPEPTTVAPAGAQGLTPTETLPMWLRCRSQGPMPTRRGHTHRHDEPIRPRITRQRCARRACPDQTRERTPQRVPPVLHRHSSGNRTAHGQDPPVLGRGAAKDSPDEPQHGVRRGRDVRTSKRRIMIPVVAPPLDEPPTRMRRFRAHQDEERATPPDELPRLTDRARPNVVTMAVTSPPGPPMVVHAHRRRRS